MNSVRFSGVLFPRPLYLAQLLLQLLPFSPDLRLSLLQLLDYPLLGSADLLLPGSSLRFFVASLLLRLRNFLRGGINGGEYFVRDGGRVGLGGRVGALLKRQLCCVGAARIESLLFLHSGSLAAFYRNN